MLRTVPYHTTVPIQVTSSRMPREQREQIVLDTAARLFYERGVHEVGMDELVRETGLSKPTVYRLYPTKDELIGAYLGRTAEQVLAAIDNDIATSPSPKVAARRVLKAIQADLARPGFRGCAFNNASIEFADPSHPARVAAREYRLALRERLTTIATALLPRRPAQARVLGNQLAALIDGAYTSAAHLGADGP